MLVNGLNMVGFVKCFPEPAAAPLKGFDLLVPMALLAALFFFIHSFFGSLSAHTAAVLPVVLSVGTRIPGIPMLPFAPLLVYGPDLMGVISPDATGPSPISYGSGYISRAAFWTLGLVSA